MNNTGLKTFLLVMLLTLLAFQSCSQDSIEQDAINPEEHNIKLKITPVVEELLAMGFTIEGITELEDFYLADGDLRFSKNIEDYTTNTRTHYRANTLVSDENITIKVFSTISEPPGIPSGSSWNIAIGAAISDWNATRDGCSDLFELITNESQADIIILGPESMPGGWPSGATHIFGWVNGNPSCGEPFPEVLINTNFEYSGGVAPTQSQMRNIVGHELGHAIGFRHTNGSEGMAIPGTTGSSTNSIMHGSIINRLNIGLTPLDVVAVEYLYGCNSTVNDNQNSAGAVTIENIAPDPFCYTSSFTVNGSYDSCGTGSVNIELCFIRIGGGLSGEHCIATGTFFNGNYSFSNLNLSDIPGFDPSYSYNVRARISGDIGSTSNPRSVPFTTECGGGCEVVDLDAIVVSYASYGGGFGLYQTLITWPDTHDGDYILEFTSSDACGYGTILNVGETVTYTQAGNSFNLLEAINALSNKCVEFSIRPDCAFASGDTCVFRVRSGSDPLGSPLLLFEPCEVSYSL